MHHSLLMAIAAALMKLKCLARITAVPWRVFGPGNRGNTERLRPISCAFAPADLQRAQIRAAIRGNGCRTSVDLLALPELQRRRLAVKRTQYGSSDEGFTFFIVTPADEWVS